MSEVAPAKAAVELFLNAKVFADHFLRLEGSSWTADPVGGASLQEDTVILTVQAAETSQSLYAAFTAFSTATTKYLVGRVTGFDATNYKVYIQRSDTSAWVLAKTGTAAERFVVDLSGVYSGSIKGVKIEANGSPTDSVTFDYVVICESYVFPPDKDLTDSLSVTRTLTNNEASGAQITLTNFTDDSDTYTDITDYGYGIIWASRSSTTLHDTDQKLFGGRIAAITQQQEVYGETKVSITLHGHASELFDSPELVYKLYEGEYGDTILEDTLDLMNYFVKYPHAVGWFDGGHSGSQIGSTDDRIDSSHSIELDEVVPFNVIKEILEKADNPADAVGFDAYETASGTLVGHLRGSLDFTCPVTPTFRGKIKKFDYHRVVNKQKVYGANGKEIPAGDAWTESTDGWTSDYGTLSIETIPIPKEGTYVLRGTFDGADKVLFRRDVSNQVFGFGKRKATLLEFWRNRYFTTPIPSFIPGATLGQVELWAPDSSNKFVSGLKLFSMTLGWKHFLLSLGPDSVYDEDLNPDGVWTEVGSPDWTNIQQLVFNAEDATATALVIDALKFSGMPYSATVEDATSKAAYGTKEAEPIIDQTLMSDAECQAKATEIIEAKKNPPTTIEPFTVDGDARYKPGDLLADGADSYRIIKVTHTIAESQWDTKLTVSEVL